MGVLAVPKEEMKNLVFSAINHDYSVRMHTIGEGAISCTLDIFEQAKPEKSEKSNL